MIDFLGAVKVRDGLFIGDQIAAQDYEFIASNKVTHIINTASLQISNYWQNIGVKYLNFEWMDDDTQILFDSDNVITEKIYDFIEEAHQAGESCLVHSVRA